jgi:hypothetical protein
VALVALPAVAMADEPKVEVMAEVVLASTEGNVIDPPSLAAMKEKFAQKAKYTSFKRLSQEKIAVSAKAGASVKLPNQKIATFKLEELKEGSAKVRVSVPPISTLYTVGREGSLYQAAGKHSGGDLWLVLSAVERAKP